MSSTIVTSVEAPPAVRLAAPPAGVATAAARNTYGQILKSTALIGGSSAVNIIVSIVRSKVMALLLGPSGVGLVGLFSSVAELTQSIAGLGINSSGVRQIAEAAGTGEADRIARTAAVLRRTSMAVGALGGLLLIVFSGPVSNWTFGTRDYAVPVALLSLAVFFKTVSDGQAALIQGMRRIADYARMRVLAAVAGATATLLIIFAFREQGIVPSLIVVAVVTLLSSWYYRRRVTMPKVSVTLPQVRAEAGALLKLGSAFLASSVLTTGAAYAVRAIVRNNIGIEGAGLYQSAWALGGLYVGFILQAMGSDFYPRLTATANRHDECNRLVNEQAHVSLLLAGPGVLATLTFAPLVIAIFYASTFSAAVQPLRWICLGMALRVIAWPMGYIVLAKGAQSVFFWTEVAATVVHVGLAALLIRPFGVGGATMAFFGLYVWHGLLIYAIVRRMTGFQWSTANLRTGALFLPVIGLVFVSFLVLPLWAATGIGTVAVVGTGLYSLRSVWRLVSTDRVPAGIRQMLIRLRLVPADAA